MPRNQSVTTLVAALAIFGAFTAAAARDTKPPAEDAVKKTDEAQKETPEGHSLHGEVFNAGPRQAAYLMQGVGSINFDVTTSSEEARAFVLQGIGQMHGFWYFESERSFRQAAMLDPDCAIAYWGMAYSNRRNAERAKGFIKEAMDRKDKVSQRERRYIEAFDRYVKAKSGTSDEKKKRAEKYISDLEELLFEFPDDIEAKAFLCEYLWSARRGRDQDNQLPNRRRPDSGRARRGTSAFGPPLPHSPVGHEEGRQSTGIRRPMWSGRSPDRSHVAHAGTHLFPTETLSRRRLSAGSIRTSRPCSYDEGSGAAGSDS